jgi:hypothetical protein
VRIGGVGVGVGVGDEMMTGALIVMVYVCVADVPDVLAVAVTVTLKVPDSFGVPLIVAPDCVSPPGSPLTAHVMVPVPPVAVKV